MVDDALRSALVDLVVARDDCLLAADPELGMPSALLFAVVNPLVPGDLLECLDETLRFTSESLGALDIQV